MKHRLRIWQEQPDRMGRSYWGRCTCPADWTTGPLERVDVEDDYRAHLSHQRRLEREEQG